MAGQSQDNNQLQFFWKSRNGILLQTIIVIVPSLLVLRSGVLLLAGLACSVLLSWIALRLRQRNWSDVGLKKPMNRVSVILIAIIATVVLIFLSHELRALVTTITHEPPNLEAFKSVRSNSRALLVGLIVVWIFGAFGEEMLFRGFLMNSMHSLFPTNNQTVKWGFSLILTSLLVAIGHSYQGITGMILTGVIGFCFGLVYLFSKRNLWPSILTHGFFDTVAFLFLFYGFSLDQLFK